MGTSTIGVKRILIQETLFTGVLFPIALVIWTHTAFTLLIDIVSIFCCSLLTMFLLWLRFSLPERFWLKLWGIFEPVLVTSLFTIPGIPIIPLVFMLPMLTMLIGVWGAYRFYPLRHDTRLHKARFARLDEISPLLSRTPGTDSFLMGTHKLIKHFVCVRPTKQRREIGNLLVVAPTRAGKGLLATSQMLSWKYSVIVNDIKGELFQATAGYRSRLGKVFVIDPTGVGNRYDPIRGKHTEDAFYSAATHLLFQADETDKIFTQRATGMLAELFAAARKEAIPAFVYVRSLLRSGLIKTAERLNRVDPTLATLFLDADFHDANFDNRFLLSAWETLTTRMKPLVTETVIRTLTTSDFTAQELLQSEQPITVYLRWKEQDLLSLSPLVRLLWGSLIDELTATYDSNQGAGCKPVLLLIDEAGRTAIPSLADQATTVVGRGISLWIAIQSLSQLEAVYGRARSQVLRDNMESQIYYRPADLSTAQYLEDRLGTRSLYAHSVSLKEGAETAQGLTERPISLQTAQEITQLKDREIIGFYRHLPPFKLHRIDWRNHHTLQTRRTIPAPEVSQLSSVPDIPPSPNESQISRSSDEFINPDAVFQAGSYRAHRKREARREIN